MLKSEGSVVVSTTLQAESECPRRHTAGIILEHVRLLPLVSGLRSILKCFCEKKEDQNEQKKGKFWTSHFKAHSAFTAPVVCD